MILDRTLPITCTDHARERMEERFLTFDPQSIARVIERGSSVYDSDKKTWNVSFEGISLVVSVVNPGLRSRILVITVYFRAKPENKLKRRKFAGRVRPTPATLKRMRFDQESEMESHASQ